MDPNGEAPEGHVGPVPFTPERHAGCPYHAALIERRSGEIVYLCQNPTEAGHVRQRQAWERDDKPISPEDGERRAQQSETAERQRGERRESLEVAAKVRHDFTRDLLQRPGLGGKAAPLDAARFAVAAMWGFGRGLRLGAGRARRLIWSMWTCGARRSWRPTWRRQTSEAPIWRRLTFGALSLRKQDSTSPTLKEQTSTTLISPRHFFEVLTSRRQDSTMPTSKRQPSSTHTWSKPLWAALTWREQTSGSPASRGLPSFAELLIQQSANRPSNRTSRM
jgi:hypothetical protein